MKYSSWRVIISRQPPSAIRKKYGKLRLEWHNFPLRRRCMTASFPLIEHRWKNRRVTALLALAIICTALELAGLLSGYTIHQKNANIVSALAHLGGFLSTLSMVLNGWTVRVYPYVFTVCRCVQADCREWQNSRDGTRLKYNPLKPPHRRCCTDACTDIRVYVRENTAVTETTTP